MSELRDNYDRPMLLEIPSKNQVISIYPGTGDNLLDDDIEKGYTGYIVYDVYSFEEYDRIRDGREPRDIDTEDEFSDGDIVSQGFFYIKEDIQEMTNQEVINSILSDAYEYDLTLPAYTLLDADHEGVEGFGQRIDEPAFSEKSDVIIEAMGAAGYTYDSINSGDELIFRDEYGAARFDNWHEAYGWLNTVTFDDPDVSDKVEKILKGTYKKDIPLSVQEREEIEKSAKGILKLFGGVYDYMYQNGNRTPNENILDYHEALRIGDELIKNEPNLISELVNLREDAFTSDREVAALGYAYTQNKEYVHEKVSGLGSLKDFYDYKGERAMRYDLNYNEFKENILSNIRNFLPEEYLGADISIQKVSKQGDVEKDGLIIRKEGEKVTPTIYLNEMYDINYRDGQSMDEIMQRISDMRVDFDVPDQGAVLQDFADFETIKDKIEPKLVNPELNKDYLKDKPHTMFNDLAVMYVIKMDNIPNAGGPGKGAALISDKLLESYGITVDELHKTAMKNMSEKEPNIKGLNEVISTMLGNEDYDMIPDEAKIFVLSNDNLCNGANMLLNDNAMSKLGDIMKGDFAIIPSSIHEVLIMPMELAKMQDIDLMIKEVNATTVDVSEQLSDHMYVYNNELGQVQMPEVYFGYSAFDPEHITEQSWGTFKEHAREHDLQPVYDKAYGNFHGNAKVYEMNGDAVLESYGEPVAFVHDGKVAMLVSDSVSVATAMHIQEFANQHEGEYAYKSFADIPRYKEAPEKEAPNQENKPERANNITPTAKQQLFGDDRGMTRS